MIHLVQLFKCLADETRLNAMLLLHKEGALCVCELMDALKDSQPKISRHLAQLRNCGLLSDERRGQWVYYRINPVVPEWVVALLDQAAIAHQPKLSELQAALQKMPNRPSCC